MSETSEPEPVIIRIQCQRKEILEVDLRIARLIKAIRIEIDLVKEAKWDGIIDYALVSRRDVRLPIMKKVLSWVEHFNDGPDDGQSLPGGYANWTDRFLNEGLDDRREIWDAAMNLGMDDLEKVVSMSLALTREKAIPEINKILEDCGLLMICRPSQDETSPPEANVQE